MHSFDNGKLLNHLINTFLRLDQSTKIKQGLLLCKNITHQEWICLWVSFL